MFFLGVILTVLIPIILGGWVSKPFHSFRRFSGWFAVGTVVGLVSFSWINFLFAMIFRKITWGGILLSLLFFGLLSFYIRKRNQCKPIDSLELRDAKKTRVLVFLILGGLFLLVLSCFREIFHVRPDGYYTGFKNNLGDLPLHIHYISGFLFADKFFPENPILSGMPLRYPFLSDFYSSLVWFATKNLEVSLEFPGLLLGISFVILFYQLVLQLSGSRLAGAFAPLLFLLNGSMGWWLWFKERLHGESLTHGYSLYPKGGFEWGNVLYTLMVPQRSLQFAFPLMILLWSITLEAAKNKDAKKFLFLAFLSGSLPFFHGHSVIVLTVMGLVFLIRYPSKDWLYLLVPLGIIWLPQMLYLAQIIGPKSIEAKSFLGWEFGWQSKVFEMPWFWIKNTGPFIPLSLFGVWYLLKKNPKHPEIISLFLGSLLIFILGNSVNFAPWGWDNIKILIYWYLAALPLIALLLSKCFSKKQIFLFPLGLLFIFSLTFSGFLDISKAIGINGENLRILTNQQIQVAEFIKEKLPKNARFVIEPTYNSTLVLTGRSLLMGYGGHIWSHGYNSRLRRKALNRISEGEPGTIDLLKKYDLTHVLLGKRELDAGFLKEFFDQNFKLVFEDQAYHPIRIYEVPI